jgi:signal transduction histidine kinase
MAAQTTRRRPVLVIYVTAMSLLGTSVFASALAHLGREDLVPLAVLLPLGIVTESLVLRSSGAMTHSLSMLVFLTAIPLVPTPVMPVLGFIVNVPAAIRLGKPWFRGMFNASQSAIVMMTASQVWWLSTGGVADGSAFLDRLPSMVLTATVYYLLNSWIIAVAVALHERLSPWAAWRAGRHDVLLPQVGMCVLAILFDWAWLEDPRAVPLLLVPVGVTWACFRQVAALKAKSEIERSLREESQQLAVRWATLADVSHRLGERLDVGTVLQTGANLIVQHCADAAHIVLEDGRAADSSSSGTPAAVRSWLAAGPSGPSDLVAAFRIVQLRGAGDVVGTLFVAWIANAPTPSQLVLLEPLADRIALAIHEALLLRQAAEVETVRELQRAKGEFLAAVSHEMRAPVGLLSGYGELLAIRPGPRQQVQWIGTHMGAATRQLARMIDDLLDAGRIESGRFSLNLRVVDACEVAALACDAARAAHPGHCFAFACCAEDLTVRADADRVRQVLTNLLSNAARYAPAGTRVSTTVERRGGEVVVAVEDEGPGVPAAERGRIFEKFYRTERVKGRADGGLGLGLAIASDIVAAHGGRILIEDAQSGGGGARFIFTLPLEVPMWREKGSSSNDP